MFPNLKYYCNIWILYIIRKVIRNKYYIKWIGMWGRTGDIRWSEGAYDSSCEYRKRKNIKYFKNLIIIFGFVLDNVFYDMIKIFSFICKCGHGWLLH